MKKLVYLTLLIVLIAGFSGGCKKDKGDPPALPPAESMLIDFSNFISSSKSAENGFDSKGTENLNWETAAFIAGTWRTIIVVTLAIPVASFKVAVDQDPVYLSDKKWQWSYNVNAAGVIYKARLTGEIKASDVKWEMYISADNSAEFKWFEGTSKVDGTGGQWLLSESSTIQNPILQIDWTKSGTTIGSIKYTYLNSSSLNANFNVHYYNTSLGRFSDVNIEWNTSTREGRIKSSDYLNGVWQCWDANRVNTTCL